MLRRVFYLIFLFNIAISGMAFSATPGKPFTVVIDAGHGGKDPGALGSLVREKDVVLDVALKFGKLISNNNPDVKVIYTRSTDVFIPLNQRAQIANKAKANLFISIHADWAESKTAKGPTTFILGQNRSKENLELVKRENSVILLEDDYKQRYEGFDPNSAESYIMFEFLQDTYLSQSIKFASIVQKKFTNAGRHDRGVRQDIFLVLRNTSMPAALVELGFLTNKEEELFLKSESGKSTLASSLYKAFVEFKEEYDNKSGYKRESTTTNSDTEKVVSSIPKIENIAKSESNEDVEITFRVQLLTSPKKLSTGDHKMKDTKMDFYLDKGSYKYTFGKWTTFKEADSARKELRTKFPDAFVVAFQKDIRIPLQDARKITGQ